MFERWLDDNALRALGAGILYGLLYLLGSYLLSLPGRRAARRPTRRRARSTRREWWPVLVEMAGLIYAVAFPFLLLLDGTFAARDIGILPVDWSAVFPWALTLTGGAIIWLVILWGGYWRRHARPELWPQGEDEQLSLLLVHAVRREAELTVWRAAMMPLAGRYWGIWLAVGARWLISRLTGGVHRALKQPAQRPFVFLDWALDWVSGLLFLFSGSLWVSLAGRLLGRAAVLIVYSIISLRQRARQRTTDEASVEASSVGIGDGSASVGLADDQR